MIQIINNGTTVSFQPLDEVGQDFIDSLGTEPWQFLGKTLVVDWRMGRDIVERFSDEIEFVS
jgi:hypothetical protein